MWYGTYQIVDGISDEKAVELIEACSPDSILALIALARRAAPATTDSAAQPDTLTPQSVALLRKGLRDWETPENRYAAQRVLDAIEARATLAPVSAQQGAAKIPCDNCDGKGGWKTGEWVDPISGPECSHERCEVCMGSGIDPEGAAKAPAAQAVTARFLSATPGFNTMKLSYIGALPDWIEADMPLRVTPASTPDAVTTSEDARDAARFRQAIALEDNADTLHAAVLNNAPDGEAIRAEFDAAMRATQQEGGK
jgi:hypothetical protein